MKKTLIPFLQYARKAIHHPQKWLGIIFCFILYVPLLEAATDTQKKKSVLFVSGDLSNMLQFKKRLFGDNEMEGYNDTDILIVENEEISFRLICLSLHSNSFKDKNLAEKRTQALKELKPNGIIFGMESSIEYFKDMFKDVESIQKNADYFRRYIELKEPGSDNEDSEKYKKSFKSNAWRNAGYYIGNLSKTYKTLKEEYGNNEQFKEQIKKDKKLALYKAFMTEEGIRKIDTLEYWEDNGQPIEHASKFINLDKILLLEMGEETGEDLQQKIEKFLENCPEEGISADSFIDISSPNDTSVQPSNPGNNQGDTLQNQANNTNDASIQPSNPGSPGNNQGDTLQNQANNTNDASVQPLNPGSPANNQGNLSQNQANNTDDPLYEGTTSYPVKIYVLIVFGGIFLGLFLWKNPKKKSLSPKMKKLLLPEGKILPPRKRRHTSSVEDKNVP